MQINYKQVVIWDSSLIDVSFLGSEQSVLAALRGLAISGCKITTGAPSAVAGQWAPGAVIHNLVDGTIYQMTGTTAAPAWTLISFGGNASFGNTAKTALTTVRGSLKIDNRPTGGALGDYAEQIRAVVGKTSGTYIGIDNETHLAANGTTSIRSTQGVAVLDDTFTMTGGSLIGVYGQARADGTFNNAAGFVTGVYGIIEASAAITASHVSAGWFDSHQVNAITGEYELIYMSNNGSLALDQMMYAYGDANALININYGASTPAYVTTGSAASGTPIKLKIIFNGTPYFLNAYPTDNA